MRSLKRPCYVLVAFLLSFSIYAMDDPQLDEDVIQLNQAECVNQNFQQCLNDVCLTSDSTDCSQQCQSLANDKCQQEADD